MKKVHKVIKENPGLIRILFSFVHLQLSNKGKTRALYVNIITSIGK
ncbi:hypothetical protein HMPREF9412_4121 [Paenibacillus sp. HGF5]|nr:hypothetical protein HMPREF9412_4121 [Paenibacillus sp. HGF5]